MKFKDYLMEQYVEEKHPLDDDMADGFPDWFDNQDMTSICNYAEMWKLDADIKRTEEERDKIAIELSNLNK